MRTTCESGACQQARDLYADDRIAEANWLDALCEFHTSVLNVANILSASHSPADADHARQRARSPDLECGTCRALDDLDEDLGLRYRVRIRQSLAPVASTAVGAAPLAETHSGPPVGIPYGSHEAVGRTVIVTCPICLKRIPGPTTDDEDEATKGANTAYAAHYQEAHA